MSFDWLPLASRRFDEQVGRTSAPEMIASISAHTVEKSRKKHTLYTNKKQWILGNLGILGKAVRVPLFGRCGLRQCLVVLGPVMN